MRQEASLTPTLVIDKIVEKLKKEYEGINIVGYRNGCIKTKEEKAAVSTFIQAMCSAPPNGESTTILNSHTACSRSLRDLNDRFACSSLPGGLSSTRNRNTLP